MENKYFPDTTTLRNVWNRTDIDVKEVKMIIDLLYEIKSYYDIIEILKTKLDDRLETLKKLEKKYSLEIR